MFHFEKDFVDKNNERLMEQNRIRKLLNVLRQQYYVIDDEWLDKVFIREGKYGFEQRGAGNWLPFKPEFDIWGKPNTYFWFRQEFTVPERMAGKELWYEISPRDDGGWEWANPQGLLYVNGEPSQAMDSNHNRARLSKNCKAGDVYSLYYSAFTDKLYFKTPLRFRSRIMTVDPDVERLWLDLLVPFETAQLLNIDDYRRYDIINAIVGALNLLDLREGRGPAFMESLRAARERFSKEFYDKYEGKAEDVTAAAVGHTHIDVAWLWDVTQTRDKAVRTFTTVLRLMEDYPGFIFMSSQPQLYAFLKEDCPEIYEKVKERVKEGRWETEGGMWLEADTNLTSGESLVRQFIYGKSFFEKEFEADNQILWLPDVFGYSAALPQIMRKCGIKYFMTTKISWNEYDKLPYDTFAWRGIDGSEVLTHFIPTRQYEEQEKDWMSTYNGWTDPSAVMGGWKRYQQKDINREFLISYGHGDGGGGPTREMIEIAGRIERGIPGCPKVKLSKSLDFFKKLERDVAGNRNLPRWVGELYFEYHRGTYTTIAKTKKYNRKAEIALHDVEWLFTWANVLGLEAEYPEEWLDSAWKTVLLNQFHDILPGSSIKEVYDQSWDQYEKLLTAAEAEKQKALDALTDYFAPADGGAVIINTSPAASAGPVFLEDAMDGWQKTHDGRFVLYVDHIPAGSAAVYEPNGDSAPAPLLAAREYELENAFIRVCFDGKYNISSLIEKTSGIDLVRPGECINRLVAYEDRPLVDDAWNIQAYYKDKNWAVDHVENAVLLEDGPCRAVLRVKRLYGASEIIQDFVLYAGAKRLDVETKIDWKQHNCLLKAEFPINVNAVKASFDIQFGNVERSTHENTLWDFAQFEVCAHKWADLSDSGAGLSLLNDCKYGYSAKDNTLTLSLLRGTTYPNEAADQGGHTFIYSLYPHAGGWREAGTVAQAYALNFPLYVRAGSSSYVRAGIGRNAAPAALAVCSAENVLVETAKKALDGDGLILRIYECHNKSTTCTLNLAAVPRRAEIVNLLEREPVRIECSGNEIKLSVKPYEILTLKIVF